MARQPTKAKLPLALLFIDEIDERINFGDVRIPHTDEQGKGYQRDPWERLTWIEKREEKFDPALYRELEVSKRDDGTYAVIDGGGRWLLGQFVKPMLTEVYCRVHHGLTRADEAALFVKFAKQVTGLNPVNVFNAGLAAGDEEKIAIAEQILPYKVARGGAGTLKSVVQLEVMHDHSPALLSKTCKLIARSWGDYNNGVFGDRAETKIDGKFIVSIAMLIEAGCNNARLREVLHANTINDVAQGVRRDFAESIGTRTATSALFAAKWLMRKYNFRNREKVDERLLIDSSIWLRYSNPIEEPEEDRRAA